MDANKRTIKVDGISVSYLDSKVLTDISFELDTGSIIGIIGPNGAGKSTLMNTMLGLIKPISGSVIFDGKELKYIRKDVSYVKQKIDQDLTFPIRVKDVVMMGLYHEQGFFKIPTKAHKKIVIEALKKVGMDIYANRQISQLSGGQMQRVFIARVIAQNPKYVFLDEPFAAVDVASEEKIMSIIREMKRDGKTILMVHHDLDKVKDYFDQVIVLNKKIYACGRTKTIFTKENVIKAYNSPILNLFNEEGL